MGQSAKSVRKGSRNTLAENYLSTQFNASSRNESVEQKSFAVSGHKKQFSNFSVHQELQKLRKPRPGHEPPVSQKFLEVPHRHEFSMIKQKRVKSQVQIQPESNALNFTSINRINREIQNSRRQHSQYYQEQPGGSAHSKTIRSYQDDSVSRESAQEKREKSQSRDEDPVKKFAYQSHFEEVDDDDEKVDPEDFFYEQLGNIYCKRAEDYCGACLKILRRIRRKCGSCGQSQSQRDSEGGSEPEEDCNETCLNCWNMLSSYAENCLQCGDEAGMRSRNVTFGNRIMIRKKSDINQIGETLVDFDDKCHFDFAMEPRVKLESTENSQKRGNKPKKRNRAQAKRKSGDERMGEPKKTLSIRIPELPKKKEQFKWSWKEQGNGSYKTHSNSGEHEPSTHFDVRDPYMIGVGMRMDEAPSRTVSTGGVGIRKKANSNTLEQRKHRHIAESKKVKAKLAKKISILKSKKNSVKRTDVFKKKKANFGGLRKKVNICLDMSQNPNKASHLTENEPMALKSCSMKNTVSKFRFDNPVQMRNFELRPKFRAPETNAGLDSRREQSINLIYKGKAKLRRNHTTKLLRNISCHRDNQLDLNYGQKGKRGAK